LTFFESKILCLPRAAIGGLIATSIVGNLTGTSIVQQAEEPIVAADLDAAIVVMALLVAFDLAFID
jgi:hypothetical protein